MLSTQQPTVGSLCHGPGSFLPPAKWVSVSFTRQTRLIRTRKAVLRERAIVFLSFTLTNTQTLTTLVLLHTSKHTHALMVLGIHRCGLWILSIDSIFHQLDRELSAQYQLARFHEDIISIPLPISPSTRIHWPNLCVFISSIRNGFICKVHVFRYSCYVIFICPDILGLAEWVFPRMSLCV